MGKKHSFKHEKNPDQVRKPKKEKETKTKGSKTQAWEEDDFLDMGVEDGLKNHGFGEYSDFEEEDF